VLDSIRMLGNIHHLQSEAELIPLLDSQDMLVRTYVYEALLRLQNYSVLPAAEDWLLAQPAPPDAVLLPLEGSLLRMQYRLVCEIAAVRDPAYAPAMERLLDLPRKDMREEIVQGLRAIASQQAKHFQE
jgi:HEAT repeat protein